jgi:hypothetical protein
MAGVLEETGTANPSITPEFTPVFGGVGVLVSVFCMSSSCVPGVAIVSGLSILDWSLDADNTTAGHRRCYCAVKLQFHFAAFL